jgi:hypothetical protein
MEKKIENKTENKTEEKENKTEEKENKTFFEKLWDDFKKGVKENYKTLILISIVGFLIIYINIPNDELCSIKMKGGDNTNMGKSTTPSASAGNSPKSGPEGSNKKKSSFMKFNPLSGGINIMTWCVKNIVLFYLFLLFIVLIPSVPIVLYITVFYFIMIGLVGKLNSV